MSRTKQSEVGRKEAEVIKNLVKDQLQFQPENQFQQESSAETDDTIFICDANGCESVCSTDLIGDFLKFSLESYSDSDE